MPIQASGLISGMDTGALISQLLQLERTPIRRMEQKQSDYRLQISHIGSLKSKMQSLTDALEDLDTISKVLANTASVSDEDFATVTADGDAAEGSYQLGVTSLATAEKDRSVGFASAFGEVKEGTLTIEVHGHDPVDVSIAAAASLTEVRDAINSADAPVSATIINTGTQSYLSITSLESGHEVGGVASDAIKITETYTGASGTELGLTEVTTATNAVFNVDGLNFERSKNTINDAIDGLTLNLSQVTASDLTISVQPDHEEVGNRLDTFVDAFNSVLAVIDGMATGQSSVARMARSDLQNILSSAVPGITSDFPSLGSIGIETDPHSGVVSLDREALEDALASDSFNVARLFTLDTDGIVAAMTEKLEAYTDGTDGILKASEDTLNTRIDSLDDRISFQERRVERYEVRLNRQFTALETMLVELQQNEASLMGIF